MIPEYGTAMFTSFKYTLFTQTALFIITVTTHECDQFQGLRSYYLAHPLPKAITSLNYLLKAAKFPPESLKNHLISDLITPETVARYKSEQLQGAGVCCASTQEDITFLTLQRSALSQPSPKLRFLVKRGIRLTTRVCVNIKTLSFKNVINMPLLARLDGYKHTST